MGNPSFASHSEGQRPTLLPNMNDNYLINANSAELFIKEYEVGLAMITLPLPSTFLVLP